MPVLTASFLINVIHASLLNALHCLPLHTYFHFSLPFYTLQLQVTHLLSVFLNAVHLCRMLGKLQVESDLKRPVQEVAH